MRILVAALGWGWLARDAWTFDDALPPGEGVPARVSIGGEPWDVTAWTPEGYELHQVVRLPETAVRPVLPSPYVRRFGTVEVSVTDDGDRLVAQVIPAPVDVGRMGLPEGAGLVTTGLLAPFEVRIDAASGALLAQQVELPPGAFVVLPGMAVRWEGGEGRVIGTEAGTVEARSALARIDSSLRLDRPDDVEIPAGVAGAAGIALLAAAGLGARRRASRAVAKAG